MRKSVLFKIILVGSIFVVAINYFFTYHQFIARFTVLSDVQQGGISSTQRQSHTTKDADGNTQEEGQSMMSPSGGGGGGSLRQLVSEPSRDDNSYLPKETDKKSHEEPDPKAKQEWGDTKEAKSGRKLSPPLPSSSSTTQTFVAAKGHDVSTQGRWRHLRTDCPDVLGLMLTGWWTQRPMTSAEKAETRKFYIDVRRNQGLPLSFQRDDSKCGNVPFPEPVNKWRAMCNPDGPTPCCYQNICTNATLQQCTCTNCTDMRTLIHAEYATWHAEEARCQPVNLSVADICHVLDGYTLAFVGDSLMRHFYIGFLMFIRGDFEFGAMPPEASQVLKKRCHGKYMYPSHCNCTKHMQSEAQACGGRVNTSYFAYYHPDGKVSPRMMIQHIMDLQKLNKAFTVVGFGSHYKLNSSRVKKDSLLPLLQKLSTTQSIQNSKILWTEIHAPSVLKSPLYAKQTHVYVKRFNADISNVLRQYDVPFFDTYNLTSHALMTFDGSHYGLGVNRAKAVILLNYILELRAKGLW